MAQRRNPKYSRQKQKASTNNGLSLMGFLKSLIWLAFNLIFIAAWATAVLCALYAYQITDDVIDRFEGKRWKVPSRVYSDSLTILPGDSLEQIGLIERLKRLKYRRIESGDPAIGEFRIDKDAVQVHLRDFKYPWESARGYWLTIETAGGVVKKLTDHVREREIPAADIEPELIARFFGSQQEDREIVRYNEVSPYLRQAIVAVEDQRFFSHFGFDPFGFTRAMLANLIHMRFSQGGSTITQQLVKNFYLTSERTITRKAKEAVMAFVLEMIYDKDAIFEAYMNEVYFAQEGSISVCGVGQASSFYFGKDVRTLGLADSALLAAMIRSPAGYDPVRKLEKAKGRRDYILKRMAGMGKITEEQAAQASAEEIKVLSRKPGKTIAPYYISFLKKQLEQRYSSDILISEGLSIFTTLDVDLQRKAEKAVREGLVELEETYKHLTKDPGRRVQAALVAIQPQTGFIRAMVGGRDFYQSPFNRAVQAKRQVGSVFKPFVYTTGFYKNYMDHSFDFTPARMVLDEKLVEPLPDTRQWMPHNYGNKYYGMISARKSLEKSLNVATARLALEIGIDDVADLAKNMGIKSELPRLPSLSLGTAELSVLEVAGAYATLANQGTHAEPIAVRDVVDQRGEVLEKKPVEIHRVLPPPVAFLTTNILEGVVNNGTGVRVRSMGFTKPCAGKTGTTNDYKDSWFVGYTPRMLAAVWVGFDDHAIPLNLPGSRAALPIWAKYMIMQAAKTFTAGFEPPEGIVRKKIDPATGKLAVFECPVIMDEYFIEGTEPTEECDAHKDSLLEFFKKKPVGENP